MVYVRQVPMDTCPATLAITPVQTWQVAIVEGDRCDGIELHCRDHDNGYAQAGFDLTIMHICPVFEPTLI
jgi:hypothetical protein